MTALANKKLQINFARDILWPILKQEIRRIRASLGHALTTAIATGVVLALFVYIFGDFIKDKLPAISPAVAATAMNGFLLLVLCFVALSVYRWTVERFYTPHSWFKVLSGLGVDAGGLLRHQQLASIVFSGLILLILAAVVTAFVAPFQTIHWIVLLGLIGGTPFYQKLVTGRLSSNLQDQPPASAQGDLEPLVAWRKSRIERTAWRGRPLKILAALPIIFGAVGLLLGARLELAFISSLVGGIMLAWTVPLLIDEDLNTTWIERQAAVTHDRWIGAWQKIFGHWSLLVFVTTSILTAVTLSIHLGSAVFSIEGLLSIIKNSALSGLLAAFPVGIATAFVMQIDGKRPLTNIILITLLGLFVGTAVIALPYLAPLIYLLYREAHRYQGGRFARGSYH